MSFFYQEASLALCLWILLSVTFVIALLILSAFEGKREELRENVICPDGSFTAAITDCFTEPQDKLKKLENRIISKCTKLEISQDKIQETKRTISELEITSGEVQVKYQELLKQLKLELSKTESECQHLHEQIEKITNKRDRLRQELNEVGFSLKITNNESAANLEEDILSYDLLNEEHSFSLLEEKKQRNFGISVIESVSSI